MAVKAEVANYLKSLAQEYGLDEKALLKKAEEDEKAAKLIEEGVMLRSDYSRRQDELKTKEQSLDSQFQTWKSDYYNNEVLTKWNERESQYQTAKQREQALAAQVAAYQATYGTLEGFQPVSTTQQTQQTQQQTQQQQKYMTPEEVAQFTGNFWKLANKLSFDHFQEFGKPLDGDALEQFAVKGKYNDLRYAYNDYVKPQRETKAAEELEAKKAQWKKEAVDEWKSSHPEIPIDNRAPGGAGSPLFRQPSADDKAAAVLNDPNAPGFAKDAVLREQFMRDMAGVTGSGIIAGK